VNPKVHIRAVLAAAIGLLVVALVLLAYRAGTVESGGSPSSSVGVADR
jgi:hypothetical protein